MKFARRLISHLTPEWRNHYIHYEELKVKIYDMVNKSCHKTEQPVSPEHKQEEGTTHGTSYTVPSYS